MVKSMVKPIHEHDCSCCEFHGSYAWKTQVFDLYYCPQGGDYIARYGSQGDYISSSAESALHYTESHPIRQLIALLVKRGEKNSS